MNGENHPADKPPVERRRFPRFKTAVPVELRPEGSAVSTHSQTSDLSLGGCYVEMNFALATKTKLRLVLWVEDERVTTEAVVITHDRGFGNGVQFLNMPAEDQARIKKYLDTLEQ